jgi:hypothetical protein
MLKSNTVTQQILAFIKDKVRAINMPAKKGKSKQGYSNVYVVTDHYWMTNMEIIHTPQQNSRIDTFAS